MKKTATKPRETLETLAAALRLIRDNQEHQAQRVNEILTRLRPPVPEVANIPRRSNPVPAVLAICDILRAQAYAAIAEGPGYTDFSAEIFRHEFRIRVRDDGTYEWTLGKDNDTDAAIRRAIATPRVRWLTVDDVPVGRVLIRWQGVVGLLNGARETAGLVVSLPGSGWVGVGTLRGQNAEWKPVDGGAWQFMEGTVL